MNFVRHNVFVCIFLHFSLLKGSISIAQIRVSRLKITANSSVQILLAPP